MTAKKALEQVVIDADQRIADAGRRALTAEDAATRLMASRTALGEVVQEEVA